MKVLDQSDTEVDGEVFEEILKESPGTLRVVFKNEGLGNNSSFTHVHVKVKGWVGVISYICYPIFFFLHFSIQMLLYHHHHHPL